MTGGKLIRMAALVVGPLPRGSPAANKKYGSKGESLAHNDEHQSAKLAIEVIDLRHSRMTVLSYRQATARTERGEHESNISTTETAVRIHYCVSTLLDNLLLVAV